MIRYKMVSYEEEIPSSLEDFEKWEFTSGGTTGEDFKIFARKFRSYIKKNLPLNAELASFSNGHYILSGFIKRENNFVYFSISDVRYSRNGWLKDILVRTADSDQDYTGGSNDYTSLKLFTSSVDKLLTLKTA